jgi:hypothetical protein
MMTVIVVVMAIAVVMGTVTIVRVGCNSSVIPSTPAPGRVVVKVGMVADL